MRVIFTNDFDNDIDKITTETIVRRAMNVVEKMESANSIREIPNVKAMQGYPGFYRYRFGDFRIGFQLIDKNTIKLLILEHRSKVYRHFPDKYL